MDKYIIIPLWMQKLIQEFLEKEKPMLFKDLLKSALASKNKQAHRISSDTKRGRQLLAENKQADNIVGGKSDARESLRDIKFRSNSKTDI